MDLDEALAVYEYLKRRPPGDRSEEEERAFKYAWGVICQYAAEVIKRRGI